ncbi:lipoprotein YvcA [Bacillus mojavensis]|uniref:lipoprotein YvcA n=1 Tax=Bacillus mojavensis TaxID=72360 RepID=UPI002DBE715C|nr:lipoprotein YvcA [Bacillus mojavensis]MEC1288826.1 lipoprotein YvcA [Bacillus mojavensis]MEC1704004.1 lipoprotein YvcA [Bacillus mojavensis]MEC5245852.1 lipoprotein YvcA [Bacillus mojavensis]
MKKIIFICFSLLLALTGGCSMNDNEKNSKNNENKTESVKPKDMDPKDLPQVPAFQDEKTREYMVSTKEEEPGYYLLESKLKGFRMLFPEGGEYLPDFSSSNGENSESIGFQSYNKNTNILLDAQVSYYKESTFINDPETMLDQISNENGYKGNFKEEKKDGKVVYSASKKSTFKNSDRKYNFSYRYFGYIKSNKEEYLGIVYSFIVRCKKDDKPCILDEGQAKEKTDTLINSITLLRNKKESRDEQ